MKFNKLQLCLALMVSFISTNSYAQIDPFSNSNTYNFYLAENNRWQSTGELPKKNIFVEKELKESYSTFISKGKIKKIHLTVQNLRDSVYVPVFESYANYSSEGLLMDSCSGDYPVTVFLNRVINGNIRKNGVFAKSTPEAPMFFSYFTYKDGLIEEAITEWHAAAPAFNISTFSAEYKDGKLRKVVGDMYNYFIQENAPIDSTKSDSERIELYDLMPDSSNIVWKYLYNKDGSLKSVKLVNRDGKNTNTYELLVDKSGKYLYESKTFFDSDSNSITQKSEYVYDKLERLIEFSYLDEMGSKIIRNYKYNNKGLLIEERMTSIYNKKKDLLSWCTYAYDNSGLLKKVTNFSGSDKLSGTESYEYNSKKQVTKFNYISDNEYDNYYINYLYNEKGNLSSKEVYKQKEKTAVYNYVYEYYN